MLKVLPIIVFLSALLIGCSSVTKEAVNTVDTQPQVSKTIVEDEVKGLKRKVVIARFSNETKHGNSFLLDENNDRIGKQASDILAARLTDSGKFLMLERGDLDKIKAEQDLANITPKFVGADFLIIGSVSEFGRSNESEVGIFSRNLKQKANATVNVRLVDVTTSQIIFSQEGSGEALSEANRVFGVGETAGYDSKLDDEALSAAISKLVSNLIENLLDQPWVAYILDVQQEQIIMSGGASQGLKQGDILRVMKRGRTVTNQQTGFDIELPRQEVAKIEVLSFSGTGNNEISICNLISGSITGLEVDQLVIQE
ncbi:MAG: curli production assembly protein CsgG [Gammaproteobacteria bacterium]|nr:curli production assembly protein CsgG [Gammaproteobacteria bacterium]